MNEFDEYQNPRSIPSYLILYEFIIYGDKNT